MGELRVVPDTLGCLCGDNLSGGFVRAVEYHASRLRTELIEQVGESLVVLADVRLVLASCVRRSLGSSKYRDRLEEFEPGQNTRRQLRCRDSQTSARQYAGLDEFE